MEPRISLITRISIQNPKHIPDPQSKVGEGFDRGPTIQNDAAAEPYAPHPANTALVVRMAHLCAAVGLVAILLLSLWLKPDPRGLGTHEQLLLGPCNFHALTGLPCPFCGMTTAFAHMARGEASEAIIAQPMGALGFVACIVLLPVALGAAVSGRNAIGVVMKLPWARLSWILGAMAAASWVFKITVTLLRKW